MKVAVTGSTGHVGANMVRGLLKEGFSVRAIYRSPDKLRALEGLGLEKMRADVLEPASLAEAFKGRDAVIHLAGIISIQGDPDGMVMRTNVEGVRNVVDVCLQCGVKKLTHFSSIHAFKYTEKDPVVDESHPPADADSFVYDHSKALGEQEILKGIEKGLDAVILNPTAVIGPHDYDHSLTGQMLRDLFNGALPALVDAGFDWVDVRDLAVATITALEKGRSGERYILSGHWASTKELAKICERISGVPAPRICLPIWVAMIGLPFLRLYSRLRKAPPLYTYESLMVLKHGNRNFSSEKAKKELGYRPRPLEDSVRNIYKWLISDH